MFFCKICKLFKNTFFYRTPQVTAQQFCIYPKITFLSNLQNTFYPVCMLSLRLASMNVFVAFDNGKTALSIKIYRCIFFFQPPCCCFLVLKGVRISYVTSTQYNTYFSRYSHVMVVTSM